MTGLCSRRDVMTGMALLAAAPAIAPARPRRRDFPADLAAFIDGVIAREMAAQQIPGAAFAFVRNGRIVHLKGYGLANIEEGRHVDPERTLFRIGSISKVFTALALVQLADRGRLRMDADINLYLRGIRVGDEFPRPVTSGHLLSHTAGFDEIRPGTQAPDAAHVAPLLDFLTGRLIRIRPPGETIAYSTYGMTLAGLLVEQLWGQDFEACLARRIWGPLGMARTNITVPAALRADMAGCYELQEGRNATARWEWYHTRPASSVNSTAADMARFMLACLAHGRAGRRHILSEGMARSMMRTHATGHPSLPGFAGGFYEDRHQGVRIIEHGGQVAGYSSHVALIPEDDAGFFIVGHHENGQLRDVVKDAILARYYASPGPRPAPTPAPAPVEELRRFAGGYAWNVWCRTCSPRRTPSTSATVEVRPDGTLFFSNRRWIRREPLLFEREDSASLIAFREDRTGRITHLFAGGFWVFDRLPEST